MLKYRCSEEHFVHSKVVMRIEALQQKMVSQPEQTMFWTLTSSWLNVSIHPPKVMTPRKSTCTVRRIKHSFASFPSWKTVSVFIYSFEIPTARDADATLHSTFSPYAHHIALKWSRFIAALVTYLLRNRIQLFHFDCQEILVHLFLVHLPSSCHMVCTMVSRVCLFNSACFRFFNLHPIPIVLVANKAMFFHRDWCW